MIIDVERGDKVKLGKDVAKRALKAMYNRDSYTVDDVQWIDLLDEITGKTGKILKPFSHTHEAMVMFGNTLVKLSYKDLVLAS